MDTTGPVASSQKLHPVLHLLIKVRVPEPSSFAFLAYLEEAALEVEYPGLELAPMWDVSVADSGLTCCVKRPTPGNRLTVRVLDLKSVV